MAAPSSEKSCSWLCTGVAALCVSVPSAVGWTAWKLARTQCEVEQLSRDLEATRKELEQRRREDEPLRAMAAVLRANSGSKVLARWSNVQEAE